MGLDATANLAFLGAPAASVAEAGSREAPALPPGLLTEVSEVPSKPTKLFIGGISRHTTTKQLRDHFAQFGRVLDCVAMRQPDGRPRGFGYVTLDSPAAADRCLREPQMIDNRIVDMKLAVPEGSSSAGTSPKEACFNMNMFGGQAGFDMFGGHAFQNWPEASGGYGHGMSWWNGKVASQNQGLDCVDLLSAARSPPTSPTGLALQSVGFRDYGETHDMLDGMGEGTSFLDEKDVLPPSSGAAQKMSASAPEFVPQGVKASQPTATDETASTETPSQARKPARVRPPLGELTNITNQVCSEDLLKPYLSPSGKLAAPRQGHLTGAGTGNETQGGLARPYRTGFLLDDDEVHESTPSSGSHEPWSPPSAASSSPEPEEKKPEEESKEIVADVEQSSPDSKDNDEDECKEGEDSNGPMSPECSNDSESGEGTSSVEDVVVDPESLPSIGSLQHFTGECKRCNFFPKGRCQNGKNCTFCHFSHDKRKPSRQEKRERRAAWLQQQEDREGVELGLQGESARCLSQVNAFPTGPLLPKHPLQAGLFHGFAEEDLYGDETLAYTIFPGLPPMHSTKLPAPLPLPGMDMSAQAGPVLPPGLAPPALTQQWQPEVVSSAPLSSALLATAPTPLSTPASTAAPTPLPTPTATPTAAMASSAAEARTTFSAATSNTTSGTQTGDYKCRRCEEGTKTIQEATTGQLWSREELLRLRDSLAKTAQASEGGHLRTVAITAAPSI